MSARASSNWRVGVARRAIIPPPGVGLAGLGYYLNRSWERIRDPLAATALVVTDEQGAGIALVALDLMYNDAAFTARIRGLSAGQTGLRPEAICVNCSHSHNAPTAGFIRGCGERDFAYLELVAGAAAEAVNEAWAARRPARLSAARTELRGMTFNRARAGGPVDPAISVLRADAVDGRPIAVAVNFHSHCTAHMELDLRAVSRDWPGEVVDQIEAELPGAKALYLQGTCGDVNFRREFNGTERRFEPARAVTRSALQALEQARPVTAPGVAAITRRVRLPTRPWTREEISLVREEALHRLKTGDSNGWLDGFARVCVNQPERLPLRYCGSVERAVAAVARFGMEWSGEALAVLDAEPSALETEVQALRIGDVLFAAHPAELFASLGLAIRAGCSDAGLFVLGYSNGSIGYLPDQAEIERGGYAAVQSPRFMSQCPFTPGAGPVLVNGLLDLLDDASA